MQGAEIPAERLNNTMMIQKSCEIGVTHIMETNPLSFEALYISMLKCRHGVMWKNSVAFFVTHGLQETIKLENSLIDGTYKPKPPKQFTIMRPKKREACSISFRDRVYQRSLNDNIIYPIMTKSFINANCSCQKGKGTDYARNLLDDYLHKFYRQHGLNGYVLQCDIHGYYPNMRHDIAENLFQSKLPQDIYEKVIAIMRNQYGGEIGYNPGSQLIQILGISMLDKMDHFIKERLRIKYYIRYMDDFILIHESKEYLEYCKEEISKYIAQIGFELHPNKTRIFPVADGVFTLGFTHRLTSAGKVLKILNPQNVRNERQRLQRLVKKCKKGEIPKDKVDQCYESWKAHASKGNSYKLIQRMNKYYKELW